MLICILPWFDILTFLPHQSRGLDDFYDFYIVASSIIVFEYFASLTELLVSYTFWLSISWVVLRPFHKTEKESRKSRIPWDTAALTPVTILAECRISSELYCSRTSHHLRALPRFIAHFEWMGKWVTRRRSEPCTVGLNSQEYRLEYWATRSSVRSHRSCSWDSDWLDGYLFCGFFSILAHSAMVHWR